MSPTRVAVIAIAAFVAAVAGMAALAAVTGAYDVAADTPHTALVRGIIAYTRERAVEARAASISVPPLTDPEMIADGASDYDEMCTSCHLAPGLAENEMRPGLNPQPPLLFKEPQGKAAEQFWIIKHGIKMTGMPAWGVTHSDGEIWNIVAFLRKLPSLSPQQYKALTHAAAGHHAHDGHMDMDH
jgi:mono/diheme cytochrome c family protein